MPKKFHYLGRYLMNEAGDGDGGAGATTTTPPADPPATPPADPPFDHSSFAQKMLGEGSDRTIKQIKAGLGQAGNTELTDVDSIVGFIKTQQDSNQKLETTAATIKEEMSKTILERDTSITELKKINSDLSLDNLISQGLRDHSLKPKDSTYFNYKLRDDYKIDEEGHIFHKATGKPMLNAAKDYASVPELIKEISLDKEGSKLFDVVEGVTGSGVTSENLTDEQVAAKLGNKDFLAKVQKAGLMEELKATTDMESTRALIAKVPD